MLTDQPRDRPQYGITMYKAESRTYEVVCLDEDGDTLDLTGFVLYLTVRYQEADANAVIEKDSTDTAEIEIMDQTADATKGRFRIYFVPDDTKSLPARSYKYDVWARTPLSKDIPIVPVSPFVLVSSVTRLPSG